VFCEDGRAFVERSVRRGEKWDYVVHDVFTGGSVPAHLFTLEMWNSVKSILSRDGVLAVVKTFLDS
jgi:spermidine synthase